MQFNLPTLEDLSLSPELLADPLSARPETDISGNINKAKNCLSASESYASEQSVVIEYLMYFYFCAALRGRIARNPELEADIVGEGKWATVDEYFNDHSVRARSSRGRKLKPLWEEFAGPDAPKYESVRNMHLRNGEKLAYMLTIMPYLFDWRAHIDLGCFAVLPMDTVEKLVEKYREAAGEGDSGMD